MIGANRSVGLEGNRVVPILPVMHYVLALIQALNAANHSPFMNATLQEPQTGTSPAPTTYSSSHLVRASMFGEDDAFTMPGGMMLQYIFRKHDYGDPLLL